MMFAMMLFHVWGEDVKVSSINSTTVAHMAALSYLSTAAWEAARMSGSTYFRDRLEK